jgi:hypothetical protein
VEKVHEEQARVRNIPTFLILKKVDSNRGYSMVVFNTVVNRELPT